MAGVVLASALAGDGERLAWVSALQHVDSFGSGVELPHVGQHRDSGPVPLEHPSAVGVCLAEPSRLSAEGSMDGKVEPAAAAEERSGAHVTPAP